MPRSQEGLARLVEREGLRDPRIAAAFRSLDRADFVPEGWEHEAYRDRPVGIPEQQTTSQPTLIARMVDAAAPGPDDSVLEVGTGLGFQTALLARLAATVVSIERHEGLSASAGENLARAGIKNVRLIVGDGWKGFAEAAPYDAIVVSAAADEVPRALTEQLAEGGRLVVPVRTSFSDEVSLYLKTEGETRRERLITPARFVPLVRDDTTEVGHE